LELFRKSLQKQISFYFVLLTLIVINTVGWLFYFQSGHYFDTELGKKLNGVARSAASLIDADLLEYIQPGSENGQFYRSLQLRLKTLKESFGLQRIYIVDLTQGLLVDSDSSGVIGADVPHLQSNLLEIESAQKGETVYSTLYRGYDGDLYKSAFAPIINKKKITTAIACVDASPVFLKVIDDIQEFLVFINLVSFVLSLALGYFLTRSITRPVKNLVQAAQRISLGDYSQAVVLSSQNEIGFLGQTFNGMQKSIRSKEKQLNALKQKAENEADAIKSYNELILQNIITGIMTIDLNGRITVLNTEAARILQLDQARSIGKHFKKVFELSHPFLAILEEMHAVPPVNSFKESEIHFKEKIIPLSLRVSPLPDSNKKIIGSNWLLEDLTKVRELQLQIKEKEWLAYLGELSAAIAHEIRNPLNSISLFLGLLKRHAGIQPKQLESINKITNEIEALDNIVSDFLNFARPSRLQKDLFSINELINNTLFLAEKEIKEKQIVIELNITPLSLTYYGDIGQLKQALLNIILNAVQAMDYRGLLQIIAKQANSGNLMIKVCDNGKGIAPEYLKKIFIPFFSTRNEGTGLGLSIVQSIIRAHTGTIVVKDHLGKGACFIIELPQRDKN
jgi:PAS domain S-box-containing protein